MEGAIGWETWHFWEKWKISCHLFFKTFFIPFGLEPHFKPNKHSYLCKTVQYVKFSCSLIQLTKYLWVEVETDTIFPTIFPGIFLLNHQQKQISQCLEHFGKSPYTIRVPLTFLECFSNKAASFPKGNNNPSVPFTCFSTRKKTKNPAPEHFRVSTIFSLFCFQK